MSSLGRAIRQKRFAIHSNQLLVLVFDSSTGSRFELAVKDCSISGLGVNIIDNTIDSESFSDGDIIPNAKLKWKDQEEFLGRLIVRISIDKKGNQHLGFSTIDKKIPLEGPLSKLLESSTEILNPWKFELSSDRFTLADFLESNQTNVDLFHRCEQFSIFHEQWKQSDKYLYRMTREPSKGTRFQLSRSRQRGRRDYLVTGSNDYLNLAAHPDVINASIEATKKYGFGSTGSPILTGMTDLHEQLEESIAKMLKMESVCLFNSGYVANVGTINSLFHNNDLAIADLISHASIHDALAMTSATHRYFRHNCTEHLDKSLAKSRDDYSGCGVITEGIFSMDGDMAPLPEIIKTAQKYNARVYVDEAHSLGVIGENGLGVCEQFNLFGKVDLIMGTLSKAFGSMGGFVAGSKTTIDWVKHYGRSYIFSTYLPPSAAAASLKAIEIFLNDQSIVKSLQKNVQMFLGGLEELGFKIPESHMSAIIPVIIGDDVKLGKMTQSLMDSGVFVPPVTYPAVSRKLSRLRFVMMSAYSVSDIDYAISALEKAMRKADFDPNQLKEKYEVKEELEKAA